MQDEIIFEGSLVALLQAVYLSDQVHGSDEDELLSRFVQRCFGDVQKVTITKKQFSDAVANLAENSDTWAEAFDIGLDEDGWIFACDYCGSEVAYGAEIIKTEEDALCSHECKHEIEDLFGEEVTP